MQAIVDDLFQDALIAQRGLLDANSEGPGDQEMIDLLRTPADDAQSAGKLKRWLAKYKVLRGINEDKRTAIAHELLRAAQRLRQQNAPVSLGDINAISGAYRVLHNAAHSALRDRKFESGASKALWLLYPDAVPMLDKNVEITLRTLSWTMPGQPTQVRGTEDRYEIFLHHWFFYHVQSAPYLARCMNAINAQDRYSYEVRIFDKILWYIGCGKYRCQS